MFKKLKDSFVNSNKGNFTLFLASVDNQWQQILVITLFFFIKTVYLFYFCGNITFKQKKTELI